MSVAGSSSSSDADGTKTALTPSGAPEEKRTVYLHVNFIKVGEINTLRETFDAEIMIKSRWREPSLDGKEEGEVSLERKWNPQISIENSVGSPQTKVVFSVERIAGKGTFVVERKKFRGTFVELMELWDFPFDVQDLSIVIKSESSIYDTRLVSEEKEMHSVQKRSFMDEQEFYLYKNVVESSPPLSVDQELGIVKQKKPRMKMTINVARLPHYYIWHMFLIMSLIFALSFTSFGIDVKLIPNRLQLSFILVVASVAFKAVISGHVPKITYFTYLDAYALTMSVMLASTCVWHALMTRVAESKRAAVDRIGLLCFVTVYVLFNLCFCTMVLLKPYRRRRQLEEKEKEYQGWYSMALEERDRQTGVQPQTIVVV